MKITTSYEFSAFNCDLIIPAIQNSYWGAGRSATGIKRAFQNSFVAGLFIGAEQVGWARATSDTVYHAFIFDLMVVPEYRGKGIGKRLTRDLMAHPQLTDVSGWMLATRDHHGLYQQFGFSEVEPNRFMTLRNSQPTGPI